MDKILKLMSMETGYCREYAYDEDESLLWVTDYNPSLHATSKAWYVIEFNPIDELKARALGTSIRPLDIDDNLG